MTRAVLYGRVSRDRLGEGRSVDSQLTELRATAEREGWRVVAEHRDDSVGASAYSGGTRVGWLAVVDLIERGLVDLLAIWAISRASRDRVAWSALLAACTARGVRLHVGGRLLDPADPDQGFDLDLGGALAVREAGVISKSIKRGHAHSAAQGRPHAAGAWAYRRTYDERGRLLSVEPIPDRAAALADAAQRVLNGASLAGLAREWNARDFGDDRTRVNQGAPGAERRIWLGRTLGRLLASPTIAGLRVHRGRVIGEGMWPAIIDTDTHRRLVALFSDEQRRVSPDSKLRHLLPGVLRCGVCGAPVRRISGTKRPPRLSCAAKHCVSILESGAVEFVAKATVALLQRGDALEAFRRRQQPEPAAEPTEDVDQLRARLAEWEAAAVDGTVSPPAFARIAAGLEQRIAEAEATAARAAAAVPAVLLEATAGDVVAWWEAATIQQRREVIRLLGSPRVLAGRGPALDRIRWPWE